MITRKPTVTSSPIGLTVSPMPTKTKPPASICITKRKEDIMAKTIGKTFEQKPKKEKKPSDEENQKEK